MLLYLYGLMAVLTVIAMIAIIPATLDLLETSCNWNDNALLQIPWLDSSEVATKTQLSAGHTCALFTLTPLFPVNSLEVLGPAYDLKSNVTSDMTMDLNE